MSNEERFINIKKENIICEDIILIPINENHIELIREWRNEENLRSTFFNNQYIYIDWHHIDFQEWRRTDFQAFSGAYFCLLFYHKCLLK